MAGFNLAELLIEFVDVGGKGGGLSNGVLLRHTQFLDLAGSSVTSCLITSLGFAIFVLKGRLRLPPSLSS